MTSNANDTTSPGPLRDRTQDILMTDQHAALVVDPSTIDDDVRLAYATHRRTANRFGIGPGATIRSGTVIYDGTTIGANLATGHNVVIREDCRIGDDFSIWSNSIVDYGCTIGNGVKLHSNIYVAQFTVIEDGAFLAPGVCIANDLYPGSPESAAVMAGPVIGAGAQIGVNVTILPYVRIGAGALIGSGAVVTSDIEAGMVAVGNPARVTKAVADLVPIDQRDDVTTAITTRGIA
jgi:acetyltransferase-like isoleucine patch superfamily enzyme